MRKALFAIFAIAMMSMLLIPVHAWSYGDPAKPDDLKYENFGPRADRLLVNLYTSEIAEWDTGLQTGKIDVTDWPLDGTHYDRYTADPAWTPTILVRGYGPEFGVYLFDLNNNNNLYLGNPPNPAYPNPVYPNPMSELALRKACAYLTNRPKLINTALGPTVAVALYSILGSSYGKYADTDISPGGAREDLAYLYNPATAAAVLDAGFFPVGGDGWRYWDKNHNGVKDAGEDFTLKIVARVDSPPRDFAATDLNAELLGVHVHTNLQHMPSGSARIQVMSQKNFHIYSGGWSLTVDPDSLILWNWDYYWHPGNPYDYAGCNNADFNLASTAVQLANNQADAVSAAWDAQIAFAEDVLSVPLYISTGFKAAKRAYTGTPGTPDAEDVYEGKYWNGFVNIPGYGIDNGDTFRNMYPEGFPYGDGSHMTVRYAFKQQEIKQWNPVYAEWLWDNTAMDLIGYDSLVGRNDYDLGQFVPWVAQSYSVGTYTHPIYGTSTKVRFTLRPGVEWNDGTPETIADIYFTFVEMDDLLAARGLPPPWWISNVVNILSFSIVDAYNFEVLLDVKSIYATGWIGGNRILPKHIWKPIVTTGDPTLNNPEPNMIASGTWRMIEYVENDHILYKANVPGGTSTTGLAGAVAITAHAGFFRWAEVNAEVYMNADHYHQIDLAAQPDHFHVDLTNERQTSITIGYNVTATAPGGTSVSATGSVTLVHGVITTVIVNITPGYGKWTVTVKITGTRYTALTYKSLFWITIAQDIAGKTWYDDYPFLPYTYKGELPTPDIKVDIQDVARASGAFGTYPGSSRWNTIVDQNGDYKIDIQDLARISAKFGWHP